MLRESEIKRRNENKFIAFHVNLKGWKEEMEWLESKQNKNKCSYKSFDNAIDQMHFLLLALPSLFKLIPSSLHSVSLLMKFEEEMNSTKKEEEE